MSSAAVVIGALRVKTKSYKQNDHDDSQLFLCEPSLNKGCQKTTKCASWMPVSNNDKILQIHEVICSVRLIHYQISAYEANSVNHDKYVRVTSNTIRSFKVSD